METTLTLAAVGLLAVVGFQGWLLLRVARQQGRIRERLDGLALIRTTRATDAATRERAKLLDALSGQQAPVFSLAEIGGTRMELNALLAPTKPLLLIFAEPRCGPCYELLPDIGGWQRVYGDRLTIALVSAGDPATNRAMTAEYGIRPVLLQQDLEVVSSYGLAQAPAAVLIQPDGRVSAGPRYGARAVRQLVADTLGLALPAPLSRDVKPVGVGKAAPPLRRPDLTGNVVDLAAYRGAPTLLLFWSPGCHHCQDLLPEILAFERSPGRPRTVIVSRGPAALNQEARFTSPVVLDDDRSIMDLFGVGGTPAAVLVDARGLVATPVARGATGVRSLLSASRILPASRLTLNADAAD